MLRSDIIKLLLFAVIVFICVDCSGQKMSQEKGLTTANFVSDNGTVFIYVPVNIKAGDQVTPGFSLEPVGRNDKQKQKALDELKKSVVTIVNPNNTSSSSSLTQVIFFSPTTGLLKVFTVQGNFKISLTDAKQHTLTADITLPEKVTTQTSPNCLVPTHALTGAPLHISGPFDGDASNTNCSLNNKELPVLAESPRECFVSYPADAKGIQTLVIHEMGQQPCVHNVSSVTMNITAGKLSLLKGERTYIDVLISGLQNLPDTAVLTLDNVTTNVVKLQPMNHIVIPLIPDSVKSGNFKRRFNIQSIKSGDFTVKVNLDLPGENPPVFADVRKAEGGKRDDGVLTAGTHTAIEIGMKKWADANTEGRNTIDYDCPNCLQCIKTLTFASNVSQVGTLGWGIITSFLSGGVKIAGGLLAKVKDIADKGGDIYKAIQELIDAGKIQVIGIKEQWCPGNQYCQVTGIIVYDVKTGCVEAIYRCRGTKMCCPFAETTYKINYCLDKDGAVIAETVTMSISH